MGDVLSSGKRINGKIWSTSNLEVSTFRNGDIIPEAKTNEEWVEAGKNEQPAWCWASNDPEGRMEYGKLYNHYAVADPRGLAPEGWRIPTGYELQALIVAHQLTDEINLPLAGCRSFVVGSLGNVGSYGNYWSSSVEGVAARGLCLGSGNAEMLSLFRSYGYSVRCLKD